MPSCTQAVRRLLLRRVHLLPRLATLVVASLFLLVSRAHSLAGNLGASTAGTPVAMGDGTSKPIEQVQPGDRALSRSDRANPDGPVVAAKVTSTTQRQHVGTVVLRLSSGETVECTPEHPFYVDGRGFVPAGRLAVGNAIVTRAGPAGRERGATGSASARGQLRAERAL